MSKHNELPVICTLTPETLATRPAGLLPGARRATTSEEIEDGRRFTFSPDALAAIASTVDAERCCCRFLRFNVIVEPDGGPVSLELTGRSRDSGEARPRARRARVIAASGT